MIIKLIELFQKILAEAKDLIEPILELIKTIGGK